MSTHRLKIEERYFERIRDGEKTSEIRFNDRDFQKGDRIEFLTLWTHEDRPSEGFFEGDYFIHLDEPFIITHVLDFPEGLKEGYVSLSIKPINQ